MYVAWYEQLHVAWSIIMFMTGVRIGSISQIGGFEEDRSVKAATWY